MDLKKRTQVYNRRKSGETFTAIAKTFGVTPAAIRGMFNSEQKRLERIQMSAKRQIEQIDLTLSDICQEIRDLRKILDYLKEKINFSGRG